MMNTTEALSRLRVRLAACPALASATLYGSYVRGERQRDSDINLAVVIRGELATIAAPLRDAWRAARVDPWILRDDELAGVVDVFATRVRDIQRRHEMLVGDDPWAALVVPRGALRLRLEQELRNHQIRLRHSEVLGDAASLAHHLRIIAGSLRHELSLIEELAGGRPSEDSAAIAAAAAARLDIARDDIDTVLACRIKPNDGALVAATRVLARAVRFVDEMEVL